MNIFKRLFPFKRKNKAVQQENTESLQVAVQTETEYVFNRLKQDGNSYFFTSTTQYVADGVLKNKTIESVFDFAYRMTFAGEGEHRSHRSGGQRDRRNGEIFANAFQGKIAECAACNLVYPYDKNAAPDFYVYKLGLWDSSDLTVLGKEISVKSTKSFGQLLLLETKDWDDAARYIPNGEKGVYDIILLIRLNPSCEDLLMKLRLFYSDAADYEDLKRVILSQKWAYNFVGYITRDDLKYIINNKYILPKNALLNGRMPMDAENYYVQAGDMHSVSELRNLFNYQKGV